jgi:hypothetical protein
MLIIVLLYVRANLADFFRLKWLPSQPRRTRYSPCRAGYWRKR